MKRFALLFLALLLNSLNVWSADDVVMLHKKICFIIWENVEPVLWIRDEDEMIPLLDISPYRRSPLIEYIGPEYATIYAGKTADAYDDAPKPVKWTEELTGFRPLGTLHLPPDLKQPMVILVPDAPAVSKIGGSAFEDHPQDFPYGTFKFFNMTKQQIAAQLGQKSFPLAPGASALVDPEKNENGVLDFALVYRDAAGESNVAQKSIYRYRVKRREIVFIKENQGQNGKFQTLSVMEYKPAE